MDNDPYYPYRKSPRAHFHNYAHGVYFITFCTEDKIHYLGEIINGEIFYSDLGHYTVQCLECISTRYRNITVEHYVVMPNHVHALIEIVESDTAPSHAVRSPLSIVVGQLKQAVTMYARRNEINFRWQRGYHDHIIRNEREHGMIAEYIIDNVARWADDIFSK